VPIKSFKDLEIWRRSIAMVERVYLLTKEFPKEELYGLTGQLRRSAVSIPSNVAEGFARNYKKEYKQFLYVALGSCAELTTQITIATKLGYVKNGVAEPFLDEVDQISRMIMALAKKLDLPDH
jgi:four helix bundle protein